MISDKEAKVKGYVDRIHYHYAPRLSAGQYLIIHKQLIKYARLEYANKLFTENNWKDGIEKYEFRYFSDNVEPYQVTKGMNTIWEHPTQQPKKFKELMSAKMYIFREKDIDDLTKYNQLENR